jgi:hypothetical protein
MTGEKMRKDIEIPEVENLFLAVSVEYNEAFKDNDYYAYLINMGETEMETVLVLSQGSDGKRRTSDMRHKIERLPAHSFARIELMQEEVLALNNSFRVTFFEGNKMHEKDFLIKKGSVKEGNLRHIGILGKRGVLIK